MNALEDAGLALWGKSHGLEKPYPLICHLLDSAAAAQAITAQMLPRSLTEAVAGHMGVSVAEWTQAAQVLAGWHDIGKASCGFQNLDKAACPAWARRHRDRASAGRHDHVGSMLAWDRLESLSGRQRGRAAQLVGGHHGLVPSLNLHYLSALGGAAQVDDDPPRELVDARRWLWNVLDEQIGPMPDVELPTPAASMTLAVVVLSDWIASSQEFIEQQQAAMAAGFNACRHYEAAQRLADEHLRATGLISPPTWKRPAASDLIDSAGARWTGLQASIDESFKPTGPGIAVILAPTGEGKTEAALIAAERFASASGRHGMFFAMPTVATAEGLHHRLDRCVERMAGQDGAPMLRRVHSQALLADSDGHTAVSNESEATRSAASWMRGTRKALLAPFGVGTVDQVLLGALRSRHSPLRILGAATGVLIVDEAHSLDPYMRWLLGRAVEWLAALGTPVVLLSATMPHKRVAELCKAYQAGVSGRGHEFGGLPDAGGYPAWVAWTASDGWSSAKSLPRRSWELRIDVDEVPRRSVDERIASLALEAFRSDANVLVARNTVQSAQETYMALRALDQSLRHGEEIQIIHSRMPRSDRAARSEEALRLFGPDRGVRPEGSIMVATQVVEQSFDVDFDVLITDPAPLSALLQRSGRVRRHSSPPDGEHAHATVVWPVGDDGAPTTWSPIYSKADLMGTYACLTRGRETSGRDIRVPADVPSLVDQADIESDEQFDFADIDADAAAEATLAQLVRIDGYKSLAAKWAIPPPHPDAPLRDLTGNFDTDETHPGTRHQAHSILLVPCSADGDGTIRLADGTPVAPTPSSTPSSALTRRVFEAGIPVSYPNPAWAGSLQHIAGGWDRTPVAGAQLLELVDGSRQAGSWRLSVDSEVGLVIKKGAT